MPKKCALSKEEIASIVAVEIEGRVMEPLKRRMSWEGKKVESYMKGFTLALEAMQSEIIKAIHDNDQSVEVIARELAHRKKSKINDPECSGNL